MREAGLRTTVFLVLVGLLVPALCLVDPSAAAVAAAAAAAVAEATLGFLPTFKASCRKTVHIFGSYCSSCTCYIV